MPARKFGVESVENYYNNMFDLSHNKLTFQTVQANSVSNCLKTYDINKATGIENVFGRFLKDGADVLAISIT